METAPHTVTRCLNHTQIRVLPRSGRGPTGQQTTQFALWIVEEDGRLRGRQGLIFSAERLRHLGRHAVAVHGLHQALPPPPPQASWLRIRMAAAVAAAAGLGPPRRIVLRCRLAAVFSYQQ